MKAVALTRYLPIDDPESLLDVDLPMPQAQGRDLRVRIEAASVNPVDAKLRAPKAQVEASPRVLGFDACGVVEAVGEDVRGFSVGDRVYYAGDVTRQGCHAQYQLVDERLVARAPESFGPAQAAALPLVSITAWELLFERMPYRFEGGGEGRSLLILNGAGGVGSIAIQLARLAGFTVIATAGRAQTRAWCERLGAHHVVDHRQPIPAQLQALGLPQVDAVLNLVDTDRYWEVVGQVIAPQGHVGLIVEPAGPLRIGDPYKAKCVGIHWEFMFARARFRTPDMAEQGRILARIAALVDAGRIQDIVSETLGPIDAATLRQAHRRLESGTTVGKLALAGFVP